MSLGLGRASEPRESERPKRPKAKRPGVLDGVAGLGKKVVWSGLPEDALVAGTNQKSFENVPLAQPWASVAGST